jgi:uncharacterized protein YdeI (YjbR/CyaY-like superfamily)
MSEIPSDFTEALKENGLEDFFSKFSNSHQREYLDWITQAKKPETRKNRIRKAIEMISTKKIKK